jgi:hypothetical protein
MYNMIVVVKDATFMWEKDAILMWAVRPDVHHDAACCGFHELIVHPGFLLMPRGAWY